MFKTVSSFKPSGDQPQAIEKLVKGFKDNKPHQTLLGVTGSGKTFTMACVIEKINKPVLVISHNKTLAAQLYSEFKEFFPHNAVEYFVSYYDYYQPEAYVPQTDTYIEKDASINDRIDCLRLSATSSLISRPDTLIVASVSCIYGLGSPGDYKELMVFLKIGDEIDRDQICRSLINIQYERNDTEFIRGQFRVRGDTVEVFPAYKETAYRIELDVDKVAKISDIDPLTGKILENEEKIGIYPAKHFVTTPDKIEQAIKSIKQELKEQLKELNKENKLLEAQRLESRTKYDLEMLQEIGYCHGIENYSRHISGREPGSRPWCLLDYFPDDYMVMIDESHVTLPQLRGMYNGDHARKETLVEHGFRLPSCLDNRPLKFDEFNKITPQLIFTSATPGEYEIRQSKGVVEQIIRPTGLIDPELEIRPMKNAIDDLVVEIRARAEKKERVLVTTLTKRMSEDLTEYLKELGLKVEYLHSEINAIERVKILKELRQNKFDTLVGINLLREGLDLPEVSLVAVLDADKEGFLRSETSLIQVAGRASRNANGAVILYADTITGSMQRAINEVNRRRKTQLEYNKKHNIKPQTIKKAIRDGIEMLHRSEEIVQQTTGLSEEEFDKELVISEMEREMELAARNLQFERAAYLRDQIKNLRPENGRKNTKSF